MMLITALAVYFALLLVRAEGPEEQARAQKVLAGCIIAGVLMAIAKPLAYWATGWNPNNTGNLPAELVNAVNNLLNLLMYIGVVVVIAGIIYGGIQLAHIKPQNSKNPDLDTQG
jgi:TRAP-type C4-dicarboxylate transport system permease large subunit